MAVYLMQHGKPVNEAVNPERPLAERGKKDVESLAEFLFKRGIRFDKVFHSGKTRARETAEIMSARLNPGKEPEAVKGLSPLDDVGEIADKINKEGGDLLIAGHLPHLSRLTSRLVTGNESVSVVGFQQGGIVCLRKNEEGGWIVAWMLIPEIVTKGA